MIEVEALTKRYGSRTALDSLSFRVDAGNVLGLLGPNGAGKTTTMRILSGYLPATSGTACIAGFEVHHQPMQVQQRLGYLPELPPLYPEMSVEDYLAFVASLKGVSAGDRPTQVQAALDQCSLSDQRSTLIRKLSKGFRQRVGIAQAIVHNPPVIILDEPTVGLDPQQILSVRALIRSLAGERTIVLSSHILPEVSALCDQIAILSQGRLVAMDSPENLARRLEGGSRYQLELSGSDSAPSVLQHLPGVESVQLVTTLPTGRQQWTVQAAAGQEPGGAIAAALVEAGITLWELRRDQASLEAVFLNLTTQEVHHHLEDLPDEAEPLFSRQQ